MLHALAAPASDREIWWLHGARNSAEHTFAAEVRGLLGRLANARARSATARRCHRHGWGRLPRIPGGCGDILDALSVPVTADAYVCGPNAFMDDIRAALPRLGVHRAHLHTEVFGAGEAITPGIAAGTGHRRPIRPPAPRCRDRRHVRPERSHGAVAR